jgi:glycosyltransferase involved in cell wall biosynthesis
MKTGINFISFRSYQGTEIFARHLLSELISIDKQGTYVIFGSAYLPDQLKLKAENTSLETVRLNPGNTISMGLYQQLLLPFKLMLKGITRFYAPLPSVPLLYPGKKVITIHDCAYDRFAEYKSTLSKLYIKSMYLAGKYFCDAIVTDSNFAKEELVSLYHIKPEKIKVIYPGIPDKPQAGEAFMGTTKSRFHITAPYFLYVGITRPRKNIPGLLKAFKRLTREQRDIQLVLAGTVDTSFVDVAGEIAALGLATRVLQTGFVSDEQKAALYKGALALVFPSYYEGFGLPVLEAQSLGTPVLTSNTSSLPEISGKGALYVDPSSIEQIAGGMEKLLNEPVRQELIRNGYENIKRFSWKTAAQQLDQVLKTLS